MPLRPALRAACSAFDGKDILPLEALALEHEDDPAYPGAVFAVAETPETEAQSAAATWLLLRRFRNDADAAGAHAERLAALLESATSWDARLHVVQCLDRAAAADGFSAAARKRIATELRPDLAHKRPFVRAWTLSVLARLASSTPSIQSWVGEAVAEAEADGPASLKARVRRLRAEDALGWFDA